jgi:hypothetical protein
MPVLEKHSITIRPGDDAIRDSDKAALPAVFDGGAAVTIPCLVTQITSGEAIESYSVRAEEPHEVYMRLDYFPLVKKGYEVEWDGVLFLATNNPIRRELGSITDHAVFVMDVQRGEER